MQMNEDHEALLDAIRESGIMNMVKNASLEHWWNFLDILIHSSLLIRENSQSSYFSSKPLHVY